MMLMKKIQKVFPRITDIPEIILTDIPFIQNGYVVSGEIRAWEGLRQEVPSPAWMSVFTKI
jgi:hypothetical protein